MLEIARFEVIRVMKRVFVLWTFNPAQIEVTVETKRNSQLELFRTFQISFSVFRLREAMPKDRKTTTGLFVLRYVATKKKKKNLRKISDVYTRRDADTKRTTECP